MFNIDSRFSLVVCPLILSLCGLSLALAQEALAYRDRGHYKEGVKTQLVDSFGLELISAVGYYPSSSEKTGNKFHARFYLPNSEPVCLVARERVNHRYYWLDEVHPSQPWAVGNTNEFTWSTSPVIDSLGLQLNDLGMLVRLGCELSSADERVAPVLLYQSQAPQKISAYQFTFKISAGVKIAAKVYATGNKPIFDQDLGYKPGPAVFDVVWQAAHEPAGNYQLTLEGYSTSDNKRVYQAVHFYHQPQTQNAYTPNKVHK